MIMRLYLAKVEMFRKIVQRCQDNNIDLKVIFGPVNALMGDRLSMRSMEGIDTSKENYVPFIRSMIFQAIHHSTVKRFQQKLQVPIFLSSRILHPFMEKPYWIKFTGWKIVVPIPVFY